MKQTILTLSFLALIGSIDAQTEPQKKQSDTTKVYICDSGGATKYHLDKDCRGLGRCTHNIVLVTKSEAIRKGKELLCGWEN